MTRPPEMIEAPLAPAQLASRWQALCADPTFDDVAGKIELTEWGEILMSPVGKTHGIASMKVGEALRKALGGHAMTEVGVATSIGVRAPDVAWCSDDYLRAVHDAPVTAGAREAWLLYPDTRRVEIYGRQGPMTTTAFDVAVDSLFT